MKKEMEENLNRYQGREHSYIKHFFLTRYLETAGFKTLQGRSRIFNFVDAFAGPWQVKDTDELSDASFDQALRRLESVRVYLGRRGMCGLKIRLFLCEKRTEAVLELNRYAKRNSQVEIRIFPGRFENNLRSISAECGDAFTFTFIDPTGWNIRSEPILEFLRILRGEFLLNFMSDHVNRHAEYPKIARSIGRFLAEPEWENDFHNLSSNWSNERRILELLKRRIKETGAATYVPDFPILKPQEERTKMRLVLGTHSLKGLEVFRDVQEKVEQEQIKTRRKIQEEKEKQIRLFPGTMDVEIQQDLAGVGSSRFRQEAEDAVTCLLSREESLRYGDIWPHVIERISMRQIHVKGLIRDMRDRGIVEYELPQRKRTLQPETRVSLVRDMAGDE